MKLMLNLCQYKDALEQNMSFHLKNARQYDRQVVGSNKILQ